MKYLIIYFLLISNTLLGQSLNEAELLIDKIYNQLVNVQKGSSIEFEYYFENDSYKMLDPIKGNLSLFSNNRFHLKFNEDENEMIQIYNGRYLKTIFLKEEEIQIDKMEDNKDLLLQNILTNHKSNFYSSIKKKEDLITTIELIPKKKYNEDVFNDCIENLKLPSCLKLPNQCKIGIHPNMNKLLEDCLHANNGYKKNNTLKVELRIDQSTLNIQSITQLNRYNGKTIINIKSVEKINEEILYSDTLYKDFEIIDLR